MKLVDRYHYGHVFYYHDAIKEVLWKDRGCGYLSPQSTSDQW